MPAMADDERLTGQLLFSLAARRLEREWHS